MRTRILVVGWCGQLSTGLIKHFINPDAICNEDDPYDIKAMGRKWGFDITKYDLFFPWVKDFNPHYIINAAAMTDVDACEQDERKAFEVNALGARNVARAAREVGAMLVHVSTDYVFNKKSIVEYNTEFDVPNPASVYGKSKLAGEIGVKEVYPESIIVRTALLYSAWNEKCFPLKMIDLAVHQPSITLSNQVITPTYVPHLCQGIEALMVRKVPGTYHVINFGITTRFQWIRKLFSMTNLDVELSEHDYDPDGDIAPRPFNSALVSLDDYGFKMPSGNSGLKAFAKALNLTIFKNFSVLQ